MTIHLSKDVESSINAAVRSGQFSSADEAVAAAWIAFTGQPREASQVEASQKDKPFWEEILELTADVPDEEWDKLPITTALSRTPRTVRDLGKLDA